MAGYIYSRKDLAAERRMVIKQCLRIAELAASETADGEGEIYIARKIADQIRTALLHSSSGTIMTEPDLDELLT